MAKLTPLAKGLVTLVILGGTAAAAWHLGLRDIVQGVAGDHGRIPQGFGCEHGSVRRRERLWLEVDRGRRWGRTAQRCQVDTGLKDWCRGFVLPAAFA